MNERLICVNTCESTNKEAMRNLSLTDRFQFAAIYTHEQTAGRGQGDHTWETTPGLNITISFLVRFQSFNIQDHFSISQRAALACRHFVSKQLPGYDVRIKWPNDILVNDQKIAGILIENILEGENITRSVIGVGVNVNQTEFGSELTNAVSLRNCTNKVYSVDQLILEFFNETEWLFSELNKQNIPEINEMYSGFLYKNKEMARFRVGDEIITAILCGVSPDGRLTVEKDGQNISFYHHEGKMLL